MLENGSVVCWTREDLTPGSASFSWEEVPEAHGLSRIALGRRTLCGIAASGSAHCTRVPGERERELQAPAELRSRRVVELALGALHGCAITEEGRLYCWGETRFGEAGRVARDAGNGASEVPLPL